jgi:hypothetical protein
MPRTFKIPAVKTESNPDVTSQFVTVVQGGSK